MILCQSLVLLYIYLGTRNSAKHVKSSDGSHGVPGDLTLDEIDYLRWIRDQVSQPLSYLMLGRKISIPAPEII